MMSKLFGAVRLRRKRARWIVVIIVLALVGFIVLRAVRDVSIPKTRAEAVAQAFAWSFPSFCYGHVIAEVDPSRPEHDRYWGVKCGAWVADGSFYGYVAVVDTANCTTLHLSVGTLGIHYQEVEALSKASGQKMAVCP